MVNPAMPTAWTVSIGEANEQLQEESGICRQRQDARPSRTSSPTPAGSPGSGRPAQLVPRRTYPLTGLRCVSRVYTEQAIFDIGTSGVTVLATFGTTRAPARTQLEEVLSVAGRSHQPGALDEAPPKRLTGERLVGGGADHDLEVFVPLLDGTA